MMIKTNFKSKEAFTAQDRNLENYCFITHSNVYFYERLKIEDVFNYYT